MGVDPVKFPEVPVSEFPVTEFPVSESPSAKSAVEFDGEMGSTGIGAWKLPILVFAVPRVVVPRVAVTLVIRRIALGFGRQFPAGHGLQAPELGWVGLAWPGRPAGRLGLAEDV
jgi:hypothetical protein